jgi:hypothetical protein
MADSSSTNAASFSSARTTKRFPVAAMCVNNEDCSPARIQPLHAAPTPTGFAEIVSDDFPRIHAALIELAFLRCTARSAASAAYLLKPSLVRCFRSVMITASDSATDCTGLIARRPAPPLRPESVGSSRDAWRRREPSPVECSFCVRSADNSRCARGFDLLPSVRRNFSTHTVRQSYTALLCVQIKSCHTARD